MSYKNRQRAGWCGKKETKEKIYKERQYAKKEIAQAEQEMLEGDDFRYKGGKRKKNEIAQLQYWLKLYERRMIEAKKRGDNCRWFGWSSYKSSYDKTKQQLIDLGVTFEEETTEHRL